LAVVVVVVEGGVIRSLPVQISLLICPDGRSKQ